MQKLLSEKENHPLQIMEVINRQKRVDSLLVTGLPEVANHATQQVYMYRLFFHRFCLYPLRFLD